MLNAENYANNYSSSVSVVEKVDEYRDRLQAAINNDELVLPTLPEVALKVRDAVESESATANDISRILVQDAALSARLIKVANSPLYRGRDPVDQVQRAVSRLGVKVVRDLVISLAMKQIFQATTEILDEQFRRTWSSAVEVAAIGHALAVLAPGLDGEQALLAGLVHNIGTLPILVLAEEDDDLVEDELVLKVLIRELQSSFGVMILESWNFPGHFLDVVKDCYRFDRGAAGAADYVDIVQVALISSGLVDGIKDRRQVAAFGRLNLDPEFDIVDAEEHQGQINETRQSLLDM